MQHRVIVVGSAVGGSAVANAFGKAGIPTLVLEKGAERDDSTRGDILHPPTLAFLDRWGVLGPLHADGSLPITTMAVTSRELGRLATYRIPPAGRRGGDRGEPPAVAPDSAVERARQPGGVCERAQPELRLGRAGSRMGPEPGRPGGGRPRQPRLAVPLPLI